MKRTFFRTLILLALLFLSSSLFSNILALGVAMGPTTIAVKDAIRSGKYERVITVFNPSETETTYYLRTDDVAGDWISFFDIAGTIPLQSLTVSGESNMPVLVRIDVPNDIPNGTYSSNIYAETEPVQTSENMGVAAILQAKTEVTIAVGGEQIIDGTVGTITARDIEAGLPLRIEVNFNNTGNIIERPGIECKISKDNVVITSFIDDKTAVKAQSQATIPVEWATAIDQDTGDYLAQVVVSLNEKVLASQDVTFKILPPGTLTKIGEITGLEYEGTPRVNYQIKINAGFRSTGQADCMAKLVAEVYFNGNLVDTVYSEDTLVPVGQTGTLVGYLKLTNAGQYTVKGHITYNGKQTDIKELSFVAEQAIISTTTTIQSAAPVTTTTSNSPLESPQSSKSSDSTTIKIIIVSACAALVIITGLSILIIRRRRASHR